MAKASGSTDRDAHCLAEREISTISIARLEVSDWGAFGDQVWAHREDWACLQCSCEEQSYIGVFLSETVAVKERGKQKVVEQPRFPWIQLE